MMNIVDIQISFPAKRVGNEWVTSKNILEVTREDGSGYSFNAVMYVNSVEVPAYFKFNRVSREIEVLVIDGNQISL